MLIHLQKNSSRRISCHVYVQESILLNTFIKTFFPWDYPQCLFYNSNSPWEMEMVVGDGRFWRGRSVIIHDGWSLHGRGQRRLVVNKYPLLSHTHTTHTQVCCSRQSISVAVSVFQEQKTRTRVDVCMSVCGQKCWPCCSQRRRKACFTVMHQRPVNLETPVPDWSARRRVRSVQVPAPLFNPPLLSRNTLLLSLLS